MRILQASAPRRGFIAALAAGTMLLGAAGPAGADGQTGEGAGTGSERVPSSTTITCPAPVPPVPLAARIPAGGSVLTINHVGSYTGGPSNPAVYVGTSTVKVTNTAAFIVTPAGTTQSDCVTPATVPVSVEVNGNSNGPTGDAGGVNCAAAAGTMIRVNSATVITFNATCTVDGNVPPATGQHSDRYTHVLEGNLTPCFLTPVAPGCEDENTGALYQGTYAAGPG